MDCEKEAGSVLSDQINEQVVVTLRLERNDRAAVIRRVAVPRSPTSFSVLKTTALRMASGLDDEDDEEEAPYREGKCRVRLHYIDDSDVEVDIGSGQELIRAMPRCEDNEVWTIFASTNITNKFAIKMKIEDKMKGTQATKIRCFSNTALSDNPYGQLKEEAIRSATGKVGSSSDCRYVQVCMRYNDTDGDTVHIESSEELDHAIRQYTEAGTLNIVATVEAGGLPECSSNTAASSDQQEAAGEQQATSIREVPPQGKDEVIASPTEQHSDQASFKAFTNLDELKAAVDSYLSDSSPTSETAETYGYPINKWDVSQVTSFKELFSAERNPKARDFKEDLGDWDVSNGKDFEDMFRGALKFNGDLSRWNMSSAKTTNGMFLGAQRFSSDLSKWDVSHVKDMDYMFEGAKYFRSDLSKWDVSSCTTTKNMFEEAGSFNSDLSGWDVSNVTDMAWMFYKATSFESDVRKWNVAKVTRMLGMFGGLERYRDEISSWDLSNVKDRNYMFAVE